MKIIGLDPGYGILGWSIISNNLELIDYGTIETSSGESIESRLLEIHNRLSVIIREFKPETAAIEKLFFQKNNKTVIDVAKSIGVIQLVLKMSNISVSEYTPTEIKYSITGYGRADKEQIQMMMKKIFKIQDIPKPDDAADALAIALCHSLKNQDAIKFQRHAVELNIK